MRDLIGCLIVATVWGATNPFIKRGTQGLNSAKTRMDEFKYLATTPSYLIPQILNLSGSLLFYLLLSKSDISFIVPVTNALTFCITFLVSQMLGEGVGNGLRDYFAISLIIAGVALCSA